MTDPIADMLTRIRNALMVNKETVEVPSSNMKRRQSRKSCSKKVTSPTSNS